MGVSSIGLGWEKVNHDDESMDVIAINRLVVGPYFGPWTRSNQVEIVECLTYN